MRFVLAIISFVLAVVLVGFGVAQRTFLAGPDSVMLSTSQTKSAPVTVIDGAALNAYKQLQTVRITGSSVISAAYGRTDDVIAWVGDTTYNHVTFDASKGTLESTLVSGTETTVPKIAGSDLWLKEYSATDKLRMRVNLPADVSVIAISNGVEAAPSGVSVQWPLDNSAPLSGPLLIAGAFFVLLGLAFLLWAFTHLRSSRGPRRTAQKPPKMPRLPRQPRYRPSKPKAIAAQKGRRATRQLMVAVPVLLVGSLTLAGCTASGIPSLTGGGATPTPTATSTDPASDTPVPAVTKSQVARIVQDVSDVTADADDRFSEKLLSSRMDGPALALRLANYSVRKKNDKLAGPVAIPAGAIGVTLPQQSATWPRTVFTVVQEDKTVAPLALVLVQQDPRSNYKVEYATSLVPDVPLPEVASAAVGAAPVSPDFKLLQMEPGLVAKSYADLLTKATKSKSYNAFEAKGDPLRVAIGAAAKAKLKKNFPKTGTVAFTTTAGKATVVALSTVNSGAIVAVDINETEAAKPKQTGATINVKGAVRALIGKAKSKTGVTTVYNDQLLFYVPSVNDSGKIVLLGFSSGLVSAKEFKK